MTTLRVFFALLPPESMHAPLMALLRQIKQNTSMAEIKWIRFEKLHITLQFLKEIKSEDLPLLISKTRLALQEIRYIPLSFGGIDWFPGARHPRILVLTLEPQDRLSALSHAIGTVIGSLNYPLETRPFRSHMSIGRISNPPPRKAPFVTIEQPNSSRFQIEKVHLIASTIDHEGSQYNTLAEFDLSP